MEWDWRNFNPIKEKTSNMSRHSYSQFDNCWLDFDERFLTLNRLNAWLTTNKTDCNSSSIYFYTDNFLNY